jgi:hypothetical protein
VATPTYAGHVLLATGGEYEIVDAGSPDEHLAP